MKVKSCAMWKSHLREAILIFGCFAFLTESAILRPYRRLASHLAPTIHSSESDAVEEARTSWRPGNIRYNNNNKPRHISGKFRPNPRRCCQVGQRVAQKQMSCDITILAMLRKHHNSVWLSAQAQPHREWTGYIYQSRLSEKVAKCSAAQPRQFAKCCSAEDTFLTHLRRCELMAGGRAGRRRCRQTYKRRKWK